VAPGDGSASDGARELALQLQQALRESGEGGSEAWRSAVERALAVAYAEGDIVALCDVVQAIVSILDSQGRLRDAISEVSHALSLAGGDRNALAMLHSMRATLLAGCGEADAARQAIHDAETDSAGADLAFARAKCAANCSVARWMMLDAEADGLGQVSLAPPTDARTSDLLLLTSYFIPFRFALGDHAAAHPSIRTFRIQSESAHHEYRLADARVFEAAEGAITEPTNIVGEVGDLPRWSWLARWRLSALRFRSALLRRNALDAGSELQGLLRVRRHARDAQLDDVNGFETLYEAAFEPALGATLEIKPPQSVHLLNLAAVLAAGEAVALCGSQSSAVQWHEWFQSSLGGHVKTCLEWPVARARIQALLALRAGNERAAKQGLEQAVAWAEAADYPVELAVARVQLSELLRHRSTGSERVWRELRQKGSETLRNGGLDTAPFAYAVAQVRPLTKGGLASSLTPRETEVLALLAQGLSYQAVGASLGVKWTTVQTLAHRCYEKLEVSGRQAAAAKARQLGIL
jgi:DNA-binding CsgD family transcriptional regulator